MDVRLGSTIGAYRIQAEIGRGGMGTVYRAVHITQGHTVALKVLAPHFSRAPALVKRFWDEYQTVRGLYHPNIVRVYEFGEDQGLYFIASEYIAGTSLEQRLAGGRALSLRETVGIVQQIAAALDAVHPRGIVHRDLKPSNVLIEYGGRVVLTDFGIASIGGARRGPDREGWWGTPEYMAPEQARGDTRITHHADIYALGVVTYQMLTGHVPFQRDMPAATLHAHIYETPPPLCAVLGRRDIPVDVERVVMQALHKDPMDRPQRAGDFARQLAAAARIRTLAGPLRHQPTPVPWPQGTQPPTSSFRRTPASRPSIISVPLLIGLAIGAVLLFLALVPPFRPRGASGTLAYACQHGEEIHICVRDDVGRRQTFVLGTHDWAPAWSPDGRYIALVSDRGGSTGIWILEPESREALPLITDGQVSASSPSWSPDGESIVFDAESEGNYEIYAQRIGDSTPTRLTTHPARDSDPAWSPDGRHIAFVSERDGDLEIYVMDVQGRSITRLTNHPGWDFGPAWSPDSGQIVYECADDFGSDIEICVMDAGGSNPHTLTDNTVDDRQPAWSPDGQYIVFCQQRADGSAWDIWVMDADGAEQRIWVQDSHSNTHPAWRP